MFDVIISYICLIPAECGVTAFLFEAEDGIECFDSPELRT